MKHRLESATISYNKLATAVSKPTYEGPWWRNGITHSPPTSEVYCSNLGPYVGKLVVVYQ